MKLSVLVPVYDDPDEAAGMVQVLRERTPAEYELEIFFADLSGDWGAKISHDPVRFPGSYLRAASLPEAKNWIVADASGDFVLFLFPGLFPTGDAVQALLRRLENDSSLLAVAGRWVNAKGKLEIGYNLRRFPTFPALVIDILLINKLLPGNRFTRQYKCHDFDHETPIDAEHANDCLLLLRKNAISRYGQFNEQYTIGWLDQVEFCEAVHNAGGRILYEPKAVFVSNERVPLINRLVRDRYPQYRHSEYLYIRNRFGRFAALLTRILVGIGMLQRIGFTLMLPEGIRGWFLTSLRSYVNDSYVRSLRRDYWIVFKRSVRGDV